MRHIINLESIEICLMNDKTINPKVAIQTMDRYSETRFTLIELLR